MATSGEKRWPPAGKFVAASGEKPMAIDRFPADEPGRRLVSMVLRSDRRVIDPLRPCAESLAIRAAGGSIRFSPCAE